jgi:putative peptidoglycan lipid II flippase
VALGVAALPAMTKAIARAGNKVDALASKELQNAGELIMWLMIPCLCFLLQNSESVTRLVYQYGKFDETSVLATSSALYAYSFSLLGYGLIKVLTSFYYAIERTSYAMKVSLFSIAVNLIANFLLIKNWGHVGLALASSCTLGFNAIFLIIGLKKERLTLNRKNLVVSIFFLSLAATLALLLQNLFTQFLQKYFLSQKIFAISEIAINGLCVTLIFAAFAAVALKIRASTRKE